MKCSNFDAFTDTDNRIFSSLGYTHPLGRTRARLIYVPVVSEEKSTYKKVAYDPWIAEATLPAHYFYQDHISKDRILAVPDDRIPSVLKAHDAFAERRLELPDSVQAFLTIFYKTTGIEASSMGLFGSWQLGFADKTSDVDFVIYGQGNLSRYLVNLEILKRNANLRSIPVEFAQDQAREHSQEIGLQYEDVITVLARRRTKYLVGESIISFSFSWTPNEAPDITIQAPMESIELLATVTDDTASFFMPRVYQVETLGHYYSVVSYWHLFKEVARSGERVRIKGTLREDGVITVEKRGEYILPS